MSAAREEVGLSLSPLPPGSPKYRRVYCACGCGVWFYAARANGRPPSYAGPEHYERERNRRRRVRNPRTGPYRRRDA